jgi:hypothetical protein
LQPRLHICELRLGVGQLAAELFPPQPQHPAHLLDAWAIAQDFGDMFQREPQTLQCQDALQWLAE